MMPANHPQNLAVPGYNRCEFFRIQQTCGACRGHGQVIKDPCKTCRGAGQTAKKVEAEVDVPAGVDNGMQIRMTGQGEPSPQGGPAGDCYCVVTVLPHGFDYRGQRFKSLSRIARTITGKQWSGPVFFGLRSGGRLK